MANSILLKEGSFNGATAYINSDNQLVTENSEFKDLFSFKERVAIWWFTQKAMKGSEFHREDYCLRHVISRAKSECQEILKSNPTKRELITLLSNLEVLRQKALAHNQHTDIRVLSHFSEAFLCDDLSEEIKQVKALTFQ